MPRLGVWELLIVLVIVLLIFGASRLRDIGKGLGGAVTSFRNEVRQGRGEEEGTTVSKASTVSAPPASGEQPKLEQPPEEEQRNS